jgi:hypothetical protein
MEWLKKRQSNEPKQFYIADMGTRIKQHILKLTGEQRIAVSTPIDMLFNRKIDINKLWNNELILTNVLRYMFHLESSHVLESLEKNMAIFFLNLGLSEFLYD